MHPSSHDPDRLANELLDQVRQDRAAATSRVPTLLRSPELMALPPAIQDQVLLHARRRSLATPATLIAFLLWGAALIAVLFIASPARVGLIVGLGWIPAFLAHTRHVRRRARRLARDFAAANVTPQ